MREKQIPPFNRGSDADAPSAKARKWVWTASPEPRYRVHEDL